MISLKNWDSGLKTGVWEVNMGIWQINRGILSLKRVRSILAFGLCDGLCLWCRALAIWSSSRGRLTGQRGLGGARGVPHPQCPPHLLTLVLRLHPLVFFLHVDQVVLAVGTPHLPRTKEESSEEGVLGRGVVV